MMGSLSRQHLLLLCVVSYYVSSHGVDCENCRMEYDILEDSLHNDPGNMERLVSAFFPTDKPTSIVVDVTYYVGKNLSLISEDEIRHAELDPTGFPPVERVLRDVEEQINLTSPTVKVLQFRWTASSINLLIGPHLLEILSLYAFKTAVAYANLAIEVDPNCYYTIPEDVNYHTCNQQSDIINLFSQLTSNVSSLNS